MLKSAASRVLIFLALFLFAQVATIAQVDRTTYKLVVPPQEVQKINDEVIAELKKKPELDGFVIFKTIDKKQWPYALYHLTEVTKPETQQGHRRAFLKAARALVYFNTGKYGRCYVDCLDAKKNNFRCSGVDSMETLSETVLRMGNSYNPEDKEFSKRVFSK
jgi:hypothetical protein